jgi:hypothetical protein
LLDAAQALHLRPIEHGSLNGVENDVSMHRVPHQHALTLARLRSCWQRG